MGRGIEERAQEIKVMDENSEAIALKNKCEETLTEGGTESEVARHNSEVSFGLRRWRRQVVERVVEGGRVITTGGSD